MKGNKVITKFTPTNEIRKMSFRQLLALGLINTVQFERHKIKEHANRLRAEGLTIDEIKNRLSVTYHLSRASIHGILYTQIGQGLKK